MANPKARRRGSELAQRVRGAERRADAMSLKDLAGMAAAGHLTDEDDGQDAGISQDFEDRPARVWSCGPAKI